jgi:hypothetical protein
MTISFRILAAGTLLLLGAGCSRNTDYVKAPESEPVQVERNVEGANASTGGATDTTVTPQLETDKLIAALPNPEAFDNTSADTPVEQMNPVPLPDGTRAEYTSVSREYTLSREEGPVAIQVSISDTRGIPVVSAFTKSFTEFQTEDGYRRPIDVNGTNAWVQYTYAPEGERNGFGSLTMLYRERFLIQIDGGLGLSEDDLIALAKAFDYDQLK